MVNELVYTFENVDIIQAANVLAKDYLKEQGRTGFGIAPTTVNSLQGARGGSRWRSTTRNSRQITMPILIFGSDRQDIETKLRRFVKLMQDDNAAPRLVATYPSGTRIYTEFHYSSGGDPVWGTDTNGSSYVRWALVLFCPDPYWTEEKPVQYTVKAAITGRGLIRTGNGGLSRLELSSSQTLGTITIENPGDVPSYPVWVITGPGDSFQASLPDGTTWKYDAAIADGEVITVNTQTKKVTNAAGDNKYGSLDDAPQFFPIPKGDSQITVDLENSTADSRVNIYFNPRRELVF